MDWLSLNQVFHWSDCKQINHGHGSAHTHIWTHTHTCLNSYAPMSSDQCQEVNEQVLSLVKKLERQKCTRSRPKQCGKFSWKLERQCTSQKEKEHRHSGTSGKSKIQPCGHVSQRTARNLCWQERVRRQRLPNTSLTRRMASHQCVRVYLGNILSLYSIL